MAVPTGGPVGVGTAVVVVDEVGAAAGVPVSLVDAGPPVLPQPIISGAIRTVQVSAVTNP
ncbi:hypothetical protein AWC30_02835 [Mycolicibacillus trivialis]|uniref:Uncharacterized protein n=1 Tax=Mycolicibacillus trivialis TaxID=1798 RepID=A0A1X2EP84_9MYCO|nr:hypothetical protein AWC30_02835 [Mycolicibacillus trivialis]